MSRLKRIRIDCRYCGRSLSAELRPGVFDLVCPRCNGITGMVVFTYASSVRFHAFPGRAGKIPLPDDRVREEAPGLTRWESVHPPPRPEPGFPHTSTPHSDEEDPPPSKAVRRRIGRSLGRKARRDGGPGPAASRGLRPGAP